LKLPPDQLIKFVSANVDSRNKVIESFYTDKILRAKIAKFVLQNKGDDDDVETCVVDSIMAFINRCYRSDFVLTSNAEAYILTTAKNMWKAKAKHKNQFTSFNIEAEIPSFETQMIGDERKALLQSTIDKLSDKCQKILLSWAQNVKMREIAIRMEYKSEGMARKKKFECMQKLKEIFNTIEID